MKDPDTGKRQARPNPEAEWVTQEAPELRIVDEDLWQAVKDRQRSLRIDGPERVIEQPEQIDVRGDLAGILAISADSKRPAVVAGRSQFEMVAGARNHRYRHSLQAAV